MLYGFKKGQLVKTLIDITGMNGAGERCIVPFGQTSDRGDRNSVFNGGNTTRLKT